MSDYRQGPPYCIQVELTEGCNLRCSFCGINGIRPKAGMFKFMNPSMARYLAASIAELGWNSRIEFAMHGEPTMNPALYEIIKSFREFLPRAYLLMESNGGGLVKNPIEKIKMLFDVGLTTLALDQYQGISLVPKIWEAVEHEGHYIGATTYTYPESGPPGNPHQRSRHPRLVRVLPIDVSTSGTHATLNNHAGAGSPKNQNAAGRRCAKPFREISIRYDGGVAVCCNDWRGELPIGNILDHEEGLAGVWHDPVMYAARRKLYAGERDFGPCDGCDALSYRPGLLPDHKGQEYLPPATNEDEDLIAEAMERGPIVEPVLRPWEKQIDAFS